MRAPIEFQLPYYPAHRHMGLYVTLRLYSNSGRMCLYVKHFIISGNKKAVTLL